MVTELEALKPIFYRVDEIAKRNPSDFDIQLMVGDVKQHLIQRGTRLKHQSPAIPRTPQPPPPLPVAPKPVGARTLGATPVAAARSEKARSDGPLTTTQQA